MFILELWAEYTLDPTFERGKIKNADRFYKVECNEKSTKILDIKLQQLEPKIEARREAVHNLPKNQKVLVPLKNSVAKLEGQLNEGKLQGAELQRVQAEKQKADAALEKATKAIESKDKTLRSLERRKQIMLKTAKRLNKVTSEAENAISRSDPMLGALAKVDIQDSSDDQQFTKTNQAGGFGGATNFSSMANSGAFGQIREALGFMPGMGV